MDLTMIPRVKAAHLPTPLEEATRLSEALGGPRIYIKRDDETGLALGGNKARKLEYLMGEARGVGADVVLTTGGPQSNHARMTVAIARRLGMDAVLILTGTDPGERLGNLLLDEVLGAEIRFAGIEDMDVIDRMLEEAASQLRQKGRRPYIVPLGGSTPMGALGYVQAALELAEQARDLNLKIDRIVIATGSGGTQAGLVLGARLAGLQTSIEGISVSRSRDQAAQRVANIANGAAALIEVPIRFGPGEIIVHDGYVGPGYGVATDEGLEAIRLTARTEGIILDPVYTGKAMAGLCDLVRRGSYRSGETIVFIHTGGGPGLLARPDLFRRS